MYNNINYLQQNTTTLGGEGWPTADIEKRAEKRNSGELLPDGTSQVRAASDRTLQEQTGAVGTPPTQPEDFAFTPRSSSARDIETLETELAEITAWLHGNRGKMGTALQR